MTPLGTFIRDVGLPLPSKIVKRDGIEKNNVIVLMLGYRKNLLPDNMICRVECIDTDYVIVRRKDSGRLALLVKRWEWEVIDSKEFGE